MHALIPLTVLPKIDSSSMVILYSSNLNRALHAVHHIASPSISMPGLWALACLRGHDCKTLFQGCCCNQANSPTTCLCLHAVHVCNLSQTQLTVLQLAFVGMTSESYQQIRIWMQYHQTIGVSLFYLFVDGQAAHPDVQAQLAALPGVTVVPRDEALIERQAHSRIWNETWLAAFFHKPCNHELFVRQSLNMESESHGPTETYFLLILNTLHHVG